MAGFSTHRLEDPQQFGTSVQALLVATGSSAGMTCYWGIHDNLDASTQEAFYSVLVMFSRGFSRNVRLTRSVFSMLPRHVEGFNNDDFKKVFSNPARRDSSCCDLRNILAQRRSCG